MTRPADPERFRRLSELFGAVADLGADARNDAIESHTDDPTLAAELRDLLAADGAGSDEDVFRRWVSGEAAAIRQAKRVEPPPSAPEG